MTRALVDQQKNIREYDKMFMVKVIFHANMSENAVFPLKCSNCLSFICLYHMQLNVLWFRTVK